MVVDEDEDEFYFQYMPGRHSCRFDGFKGFAMKHKPEDGDCLVFRLIHQRVEGEIISCFVQCFKIKQRGSAGQLLPSSFYHCGLQAHRYHVACISQFTEIFDTKQPDNEWAYKVYREIKHGRLRGRSQEEAR